MIKFAFSASEQPDRAELNGSFPGKPEPEVNSASSSDSEDTEGPEEGFDNDDDANVSKVSWQLLVIIETNLPLSGTNGMTIVKLLVMPVWLTQNILHHIGFKPNFLTSN